ncbi:Cell cycle serine threonine-kinase hsk1 [Hyphodiscus hymeniophilus]|uniref:non-specific serine/threonine protein kinase n=1 Tax=Hyphodiscus hymeniophilus TaxID=353542 RepID=A0A9P7AUU6_9HELO|nr:Cell cycle serine threonine-kinase hsk1 [Hyphodiscus hymeniophilus]
MAATRYSRMPIQIHHDDDRDELNEDLETIGDSRAEGDEDDLEGEYSEGSDDTDDVVDAAVQEDMLRFQETFKGIKDQFRLINRIGEGKSIDFRKLAANSRDTGTFSTVYKAEDLSYEKYHNDWDIEEKENSKWASPPVKKSRRDGYGISRPKYVAIKKIYVTSSPSRILNELELLNDLRGCDSVCPLITAFRCTDQVVAVLPYFRHTDFREYFRLMTVPDMQIYFRSLFSALASVHEKGILHRDIKPTNFLYEPDKRRGVLVDFGLAEREGTDSKNCLCHETSQRRRERVTSSVAATNGPAVGYPKNDPRPSRRANRAGTRGFRAPEVLFKCTEQTTKIDIWSAGVMLLTILSKRFPFFNSADDVEAMIEIATIFGRARMRQCAYLHGTVFATDIPTIGQGGFALEKIILWSTCRNDAGADGEEIPLTEEEKMAVRFLECCLELDPNKRISAKQALEHEFLREMEISDDDDDDDEMDML